MYQNTYGEGDNSKYANFAPKQRTFLDKHKSFDSLNLLIVRKMCIAANMPIFCCKIPLWLKK